MITLPNMIEAKKDALMMIQGVRDGWDSEFGRYSRLYNITTEDVKTYTEEMSSSFDTTLTIGASADQGIAATLKGAKDVYFFDINKADIYFLELKRVALATLRRRDFLDFMIAENNGNIMEYRLYQKVQKELALPIRLFWDILYEYFRYNAYYLSEELFRSPKKHGKLAQVVNGYYRNNETYYQTQKRVREANWHFIESDFYDLGKTLPEGVNYDSIILSNIYEYLNFGEEVSRENAKKYTTFIKQVLLPRLKEHGIMMGAYLCRYDEEVDTFIEEKLKSDPNGWAPSSDILSGLDMLEKYFTGWTGQNVSYHYLLQDLKKEFEIKEIATNHSGYGMSTAKNDLAILIKK